MNALRPKSLAAARALTVALALGATALTARAQALWTDGSGTDHTLSNNLNWSGGEGPNSGDNVEFDGSGSTNIVFDLPNFTLGNVTFDYANTAYVFASSNVSNVLTLTGGIYNNSAAQITITSNLQLSGCVLVQNENANLLITGNISGSGHAEIQGEATVTLTGQNTYTGGTKIDEGATLQIGNGVTTGTSFTGNICNNGYLKVSPAASDIYNYTGSITGSGSVEINGAGTVTVTAPSQNANDFSGATHVNGGILADGAVYSFSANSDLYIGPGGAVRVNYNDSVGSLQNGITGTGGISLASGVQFTTFGDYYNGDFAGVISGLGELIINSGIQGLSGNNTYSGGTLIGRGGEVYIGSNNAFGTGTITFNDYSEFAPDANVTLPNAIVLNGTNWIENDDGASYNLTLNGQITGTNGIEWCTPGVLTLGNGTNTFAGGVDIREGTLNLIATGAAGTGTIYIDSGSRLLISQGVTLSNPITLEAAGAEIAGNGTISTHFDATSNAILFPSASNGNGMGTLTFSGGLTIYSGAAIHLNLFDATGAAGTGYSSIATNGLSFDASANTITFNLVSVDASGNAADAIDFSANTYYSWTVISGVSVPTGFNPNLFHLDTSAFSNAIGTGTFSFALVGDNIVLDFNPVPEPETWALMGLGLAALIPAGLRYRRRRARA